MSVFWQLFLALTMRSYLVVVRAVAGLFQHLRTLNPRDHDFNDLYAQALKVYRHMRSKNEFRQHEIYHHM